MNNAVNDELWMQQALRLAAKGRGSVEPNPMVGAVVISADGGLVGEGWHQKFGGPHAEVHALEQAGPYAIGGTLYVTLEPCCHFGKTPPCTDLVLKSGVRRVVAAMADPFPMVAGGGLAILQVAGLAVTVGICESEAKQLNAPYLKRLRAGKPWVIAKWAMSLDGKIATQAGESKWISNEQSRAKVHELRGRVDAIIVGRGTVDADDPMLTARPAGPRIATRIVLSASGDLPHWSQLRKTARSYPVLIFTEDLNRAKLNGWVADGAEVVTVPCHDNVLSVDAILRELGRREMTNVMLEGGASLFGSFRDVGEIDETWVFVAPKLIGGVDAPSPITGEGSIRMVDVPTTKNVHVEQLGEDVFIRSRFTS